MAKIKHNWHCNICESDLTVLKGKKNTKYLYCPVCERIYAYYNKGILGKLAKGALRSLPGGDIAAELLTSNKSTPVKTAISPSYTQRKSPEEKALMVDELLKRTRA